MQDCKPCARNEGGIFTLYYAMVVLSQRLHCRARMLVLRCNDTVNPNSQIPANTLKYP